MVQKLSLKNLNVNSIELLTDEGYYIDDNDYAFATYAFATDNADELTLEEALELLEDKDIDTIVEVK